MDTPQFRSNVTFTKVPCSLDCLYEPFRNFCCYTEYYHTRCCECC